MCTSLKCFLAADTEQLYLAVTGNNCQNRYHLRCTFLNQVAQCTHQLRRFAFQLGSQYIDTMHITGQIEQIHQLHFCYLAIERLNAAAQLTHFFYHLTCTADNIIRCSLQLRCDFIQCFLTLFHHFQECPAGQCLNTAYTGSNGSLTDNLEHTSLCGVIQMGTATELDGIIACTDNTNHIAVLFTEQCHSTQLLCLFNRHLIGTDIHAFQNGIVNQRLNLCDFLRCHGSKMGKVETDMIRISIRTSLLNMAAENLTQSLLQQMGCRMGTADCLTAFLVYLTGHGITAADDTALYYTGMQVNTSVTILLYIINVNLTVAMRNGAVVRYLTAHFRIKRGLIQNNGYLGACADCIGALPLRNQSQHIAGCFQIGITAELGLERLIQTQILRSPADIAHTLTILTGTLLLLLNQSIKAFTIGAHALLLQNFDGQVNREAIGVMQLECVSSRQFLAACLLSSFNHIIQNRQTCVNRCVKAFLFHLDNLADIALLFYQSRICSAALLDDGITYLIQERLVDAKQLAMTCRTAQQTAQYITAAFIGRNDTVTDHHDGRTNMVRDDAQGNIGLVGLAIGLAGDSGNMVGDILNGIHIKQRIHILHDNSQTLQTHAGINVLLHQLGIVALSIVVELGEYVVPYFHIPVAVTAYGTARLATAILFSTVIVDFRTRTTGTGAMLPEVIFLAKAENTLCRNADLLVPDLKCLIVILINRRIQTVRIQLHHLSQELPAPCNGFLLKVITEGKVAQHFKEGAMTCGLAYILDITGTDTLLTGCHAAARRFLLTGKIRLQRSHTGVNQQQGLVTLRNQRKARQSQMFLGLKEREELFTDFIQTHVMHVNASI